MKDAASGILVEREALRQGTGIAIVASLVLHVVAITVLLLAPRPRPASRIQRPAIVRLTSFGRADDRVLSPRAARPRKAAVETATTAPPPKSAEKPKRRHDLPRSREASKETVHKSVFGQAPRKVEAPEGPKSATPAATPPGAARATAPQTLSIAGASGGTAGVSGLEGGDFPYTIYIERMLSLIGRQWFRPDLGGTRETEIYFVIERDGSIHDARVEAASGSAIFDRAALRAVVEASPLPPLPFAYQGTYLGVHLTFH